jgi:GT2 family glycosyltransferase
VTAWRIVHVDLAEGLRPVDAGGASALVVLWWRGLPLGCKAFEAAELPLRAAQIAAFAAGHIAEQARARAPALGAPFRSGVDGQPMSELGLKAAMDGGDLLPMLEVWAAEPAPEAGALSVVICTRGRPEMLKACLASLAAQARPPGEIIVIDNCASRSAEAVAAGRAGVTYLHEPRPGLSRARNAGVAAARGELVAFTDDDVGLPPNWTGEVMRAFTDPLVDAVTGLVLPASLETEAQRAFELELGGFTSRYQPLRFDGSFLERTRAMGPQVWRIGAGANMAFRRRVFTQLGGFDERLGAGASGCSEDSEYWYRILAAGGVCLYEPRAYVCHHHRAEWRALRRQYRDYMRGHVSALVAQADRYGPSGDIQRIFTQLPAHFLKTALKAIQTLSWWRLGLLAHEVAGWVMGLHYLLRPGWRQRPPRRPRGARARAAEVVGRA